MVLEILKQVWGYEQLLPLQREAIDCVLSGRDSLVVMSTGGGKSLCFQLPAVSLPGMAIVVSPLIALMKDQVDALQSLGVSAAAINSTLGAFERRSIADRVRRGEIKLLYLAPERLLAEKTLEFLAEQTVSFIAVDESHCISSWGHDFRPEYRELAKLRTFFPDIPLHAFTATATEQVRSDIVTQLGLQQPTVLVGDFRRRNLIYHVQRRETGLNQTCAVLDRFRGQSGIVYCISRTEVERISALLNETGYSTLPYHAGLSDQMRSANQDAFITEQVATIVATVAFGMGINKSNVRYVVHAEMPKSIEHYQQESGRAGRDGLESECWLLYSPADLQTWKNVVAQSSPQIQESALRSLNLMYDYCTSVECRHRTLANHFGQSDAEQCRACDVCLGRLESVVDPLVIGQKIISCVLRVRERFGAGHVSKVLAGSEAAEIMRWGHQTLSTWGILKQYRRAEIRDWIEQLAQQRFLVKEGEFQLLRVTPEGRLLLRGQATPRLLKPVGRASVSTPTTLIASWEGVDRGLFEHLRTVRRKCADDAAMPAYIVFSDATLRDMARRRPTTLNQFLSVHGVGIKKAETYGAMFVEQISDYCTQHQVEMNVNVESQLESNYSPQGASHGALAAFPLFEQGKSIDEIAESLDRANSTVMDYLCDFIRYRNVTDASRWVAPREIERVEVVAEYAGTRRLKLIHDALHGRVDYESIRIVLACRANRLSL